MAQIGRVWRWLLKACRTVGVLLRRSSTNEGNGDATGMGDVEDHQCAPGAGRRKERAMSELDCRLSASHVDTPSES